MANQTHRRTFLKSGAFAVLGASLVTRWIGNDRANAQAPKPELVKESDPQAQALGYAEDANKVDTKKWPKRAGPDGKKQFCYNCQFYVSPTDPKKSATAPCQILSNKLVKAKGWCNTWVQNPKVTG